MSNRVGDRITDGNGEEWLITKIWEHKKWFDYDLVNIKTTCFGSLRIEKKPRKK